jgi:toxin-antitoxin system PIN domain toxin
VILPDVNVVLAAHRADHPDHAALRPWLEAQLNGPAAFGMSELVLSSFLRITTNHRVFREPTPMTDALRFIEVVRTSTRLVMIRPGPRHFDLFVELCGGPSVRGNLVPDAYFAALAIEAGARWATRDRDFARFTNLDWFDPTDDG